MKCPVSRSHKFVEVAEDLFQCQDCGAGPEKFVSFKILDVENHQVDALMAVRRGQEADYYVRQVTWVVDRTGARMAGTFDEGEPIVKVSGKKAEQWPLPAVSGRGPIVRLKRHMFESDLGVKEV